jgi:hypothetical protein
MTTCVGVCGVPLHPHPPPCAHDTHMHRGLRCSGCSCCGSPHWPQCPARCCPPPHTGDRSRQRPGRQHRYPGIAGRVPFKDPAPDLRQVPGYVDYHFFNYFCKYPGIWARARARGGGGGEGELGEGEGELGEEDRGVRWGQLEAPSADVKLRPGCTARVRWSGGSGLRVPPPSPAPPLPRDSPPHAQGRLSGLRLLRVSPNADRDPPPSRTLTPRDTPQTTRDGGTSHRAAHERLPAGPAPPPPLCVLWL